MKKMFMLATAMLFAASMAFADVTKSTTDHQSCDKPAACCKKQADCCKSGSSCPKAEHASCKTHKQ